MKRLLFTNMLCFLAFLFISQTNLGQGYFNSFYGDEFERVLLANLIVHDGNIVISGVVVENEVGYYHFSKIDLEGNGIIESLINTESTTLGQVPANGFVLHGGNYYMVGSGIGGDLKGLYCLDANLDTLWVEAYSTIDQYELFSYFGSIFIQNDSLFTTESYFNENDKSSNLIVRRSPLVSSNFEVTNKFSNPSMHTVIMDLEFQNSNIIYSGSAAITFGNHQIEGMYGISSIDQFETVNSSIIENPDKNDGDVLVEEYTNDEFVLCRLNTDEEINSNYFHTTLWFEILDVNSEEIVESIPSIFIDNGRLRDFIRTPQGYAVLVSEWNGFGFSTKSVILGFNEDFEMIYQTDLELINCNDCENYLLDIDSDEFGNIYGVGYADLDNEQYDGQYGWLTSIDCHGLTEAPDLGLSIDTLQLENDNILFTGSNNVFDSLIWNFNGIQQVIDSAYINLPPGLNTVEVTGFYCGTEVTAQLELDIVVDLNELGTNSEFTVFPNPTSPGHQLTIINQSVNNQNSSYELLSSDGSLVLSIPAGNKGSTTSINLPELASGIYLLQLKKLGMVVKSEKLVIGN